jgi:hypothetical protein
MVSSRGVSLANRVLPWCYVMVPNPNVPNVNVPNSNVLNFKVPTRQIVDVIKCRTYWAVLFSDPRALRG